MRRIPVGTARSQLYLKQPPHGSKDERDRVIWDRKIVGKRGICDLNAFFRRIRHVDVLHAATRRQKKPTLLCRVEEHLRREHVVHQDDLCVGNGIQYLLRRRIPLWTGLFEFLGKLRKAHAEVFLILHSHEIDIVLLPQRVKQRAHRSGSHKLRRVVDVADVDDLSLIHLCAPPPA